jgi:uncharacterized glyoxalase superfamily protein PhnB
MHSNRPKLDDTAEIATFPAFRASGVLVSLTVKDLERSLAWYRDVLGFDVERRIERDGQTRAVSMRAGEARLLLNLDDGGRGWDRVKGEGFALTLQIAQGVDSIARRVVVQGGTLDSEPADMPWGARMFRLRDPDGFRLSVSQPTG